MRTLTTISLRPRRRAHPSAGLRYPLEAMPRRRLAALDHHGNAAPRIGADPLLTADEVAALLQVTKAWVYAQTRARRIPHVPLGRYVRYRRSAVLRWIVELERQTGRRVAVRRCGVGMR